nr:hypothetical protein [Tanacetum cinerariifolium]
VPVLPSHNTIFSQLPPTPGSKLGPSEPRRGKEKNEKRVPVLPSHNTIFSQLPPTPGSKLGPSEPRRGKEKNEK